MEFHWERFRMERRGIAAFARLEQPKYGLHDNRESNRYDQQLMDALDAFAKQEAGLSAVSRGTVSTN